MKEYTYKYKFLKKLIDLLRCPTCKYKLNPIQLIDIFLLGLVCDNNHRFFIELQSPLATETVKCASIEGPTIKNRDNLEIIRVWLTDFKFRSKLNNQLAIMIRRIYEISKDNLHIIYDYNIFKYCPLCSMPLREFKQDDVWIKGLKCKNNHEFFERDGVGFSFDGGYVNLKEEMADKVLYSLIKRWLKKEKNLQLQLHSQIKLVLMEFLKIQKCNR